MTMNVTVTKSMSVHVSVTNMLRLTIILCRLFDATTRVNDYKNCVIRTVLWLSAYLNHNQKDLYENVTLESFHDTHNLLLWFALI